MVVREMGYFAKPLLLAIVALVVLMIIAEIIFWITEKL